MTIRDQTLNYRGLAPCDPRHSSGCKGPCGSLLVLSLGLAGQRGPRRGSRLCRSHRSPGNSLEWVPVGTARWQVGTFEGESHGRLGLAHSGRVAGSRESDGSQNGVGLVAFASANLGGSCHCERPSAREGERLEEAKAKGGTRRCRDTAFTWCVWNRPFGQRERTGLNFLALAGLAARQLGDLAAWLPVGSPAQWQTPRKRDCAGTRDRATKPSRGWLRVVVRKPHLVLAEIRATWNKVTAKARAYYRGCRHHEA